MFITERWKARLMSEKPFGELSFGCVKYAIIVHSFTCTCTLMRQLNFLTGQPVNRFCNRRVNLAMLIITSRHTSRMTIPN